MIHTGVGYNRLWPTASTPALRIIPFTRLLGQAPSSVYGANQGSRAQDISARTAFPCRAVVPVSADDTRTQYMGAKMGKFKYDSQSPS